MATCFADDTLQLVSFDLGNHEYTPSSLHFLQDNFRGRLQMVLGDSTIAVPTFNSLHPDFKCDVIFIDGGHSYEVASADIRNMADLAHDGTWLAIDDISGYGSAVNDAVDTAVEEGLIDRESKRVYQDYCRQISWVSRDLRWLTFGPPTWSGLLIGHYKNVAGA